MSRAPYQKNVAWTLQTGKKFQDLLNELKSSFIAIWIFEISNFPCQEGVYIFTCAVKEDWLTVMFPNLAWNMLTNVGN